MTFENLYIILSDEFITTYKIEKEQEEFYKEKIKNFVVDLYNKDIRIVIPLDEKSTEIVRRYYGVFSSRQNALNISEDLKLSEKWTNGIMKSAFRKVFKMIYINGKQEERLSSLELFNSYNIIKTKSVAELGLNNRIKNVLSGFKIFSINDLLSYSKKELLEKGMGINIVKHLDQKISMLNLKFIDDLREEERLLLIRNSTCEKLKKSSPYLIKGFAEFENHRPNLNKRSHSLNTIEDVLEYISNEDYILDSKIILPLIFDLLKMGFVLPDKLLSNEHVLLETLEIVPCESLNYSNEAMLYITVMKMNLSSKTKNALIRFGVKNIYDIVKMRKQDLIKIRHLGAVGVTEIINYVHSLGLFFKDEERHLKLYTELIINELDNETNFVKVLKD